MGGWDPDEEPTGGSYRRTPPREAFDDPRGAERPASRSAARLRMGSRHRPASGRRRSAGRRVGTALGWVGILVIAPLIVGILAGMVGQHIGL